MRPVFPRAFIDRLKEIYPRNFESVLAELQVKPIVLRTSLDFRVQSLEKMLLHMGGSVKSVAGFECVFEIEGVSAEELTRTPEYLQGQFYIQSLASIAIPLVLDPNPGELVLDLCAAPGSKTSQIGQRLNSVRHPSHPIPGHSTPVIRRGTAGQTGHGSTGSDSSDFKDASGGENTKYRIKYEIRKTKYEIKGVKCEKRNAKYIGKSSSIGGSRKFEILKERKPIVAVELDKERAKRLREVLGLQGVSDMVEIVRQSGTNLPEEFNGAFDKVLVDAPCSADARFDIGKPRTFNHWGKHRIKGYALKQKKLIMSGLRYLKPGGTLVYSTCSMNPEENEAVVDYVLRAFRRMKVDSKIEDDGDDDGISNIQYLISKQISKSQLQSLKKGEVEVLDIELPLGRMESVMEWHGKLFDAQVAKTFRMKPCRLTQPFFVAKLRNITP